MASIPFICNIDPEKHEFPHRHFMHLSKYVQMESTTTPEKARDQIFALLAEEGLEEDLDFRLVNSCILVAIQIPYDHPSQHKLAELLKFLKKSNDENDRLNLKNYRDGFEDELDMWIMKHEALLPLDYVNLRAFYARLTERRFFRRGPYKDPIWAYSALCDFVNKRSEYFYPDMEFAMEAAVSIAILGRSLWKSILVVEEPTGSRRHRRLKKWLTWAKDETPCYSHPISFQAGIEWKAALRRSPKTAVQAGRATRACVRCT